MSDREIVLMTDHSSTEGSRAALAAAVELLTGRPPVPVDARHFLTGGSGRTRFVDRAVRLEVPTEHLVVTPSVLLVYEVQPPERRRFEPFQRLMARHGTVSLGTDADAWRAATDKDLTTARFALHGIPHMQTVTLERPSVDVAAAAFDRLGRDVWARPALGTRGDDVRHITTFAQLFQALAHFADTEQTWLISRDARNFNAAGQRHQFRVSVLDGRAVQACEHVQGRPDEPCNEAQGAACTPMPVDDLPVDLCELAVAATKAVGLRFGGVDLAVENGGAVFEVNVHPMLGAAHPAESVAVPYVEAHLAML
ncbi:MULTISPECIES: alpha-L-glutamate ligase [unclassified Streptomyces]|uniref:ATP-grasp domain-containing protein n=1 Tax=unclassified Streptomyces TaxID=2593676 RepID=UPI0033C9109D